MRDAGHVRLHSHNWERQYQQHPRGRCLDMMSIESSELRCPRHGSCYASLSGIGTFVARVECLPRDPWSLLADLQRAYPRELPHSVSSLSAGH